MAYPEDDGFYDSVDWDQAEQDVLAQKQVCASKLNVRTCGKHNREFVHCFAAVCMLCMP